MQKYTTPYLADWFAILLRWIVLLGITVSAAMDGRLGAGPFLVILLMGLWNSAASILAVLNLRLPFHRQIYTLVDLAAGVVLFQLSGGLAGPVSWVGLLVCFSAAIYFEWKGGLALAAAFSIFQAVIVLVPAPQPQNFSALAIMIGFNLGSGGVLGYLGSQLTQALRRNRTKQSGSKLDSAGHLQPLERDRLRSLYNLSTTLTSTLNYQQVLEEAQDLGADALREAYDTDNPFVSAVFLFQNGLLQVGSSRRFTPVDQRLQLAGQEGVLIQLFSDGNLLVCEQPANDPELTQITALHGCQSAALLPLRRGMNLFGVLLFAHPKPGFFTPDRLEILEIISHQVVVAIQNASLYQDLAEEKQRLIESQDEARKKLARDLHDGPTQSVSAIAMRINYIRRLLEHDRSAAQEELLKVEEMARRTTQEIRHMLFTLRPLVLESEGLRAALQAMADKVVETFGQPVSITVDEGLIGDLEINKQTVIFFIAEEAVNNARKHAQAEQIWVRLRRAYEDPELAVLEIEDNGVGFDPAGVLENYEQRGSLGMINLQERSSLVNGLLQIDSAPGKGARVLVFIPLSEAASDRLRHG